jgi:hypothetical protein
LNMLESNKKISSEERKQLMAAIKAADEISA